jgi:hypothetical protein
LNVDFLSENNGKATILITDAARKTLHEENISIIKGNNSFSMNTSHLTAGTYILSVKGKVNYSAKFIKANK